MRNKIGYTAIIVANICIMIFVSLQAKMVRHPNTVHINPPLNPTCLIHKIIQHDEPHIDVEVVCLEPITMIQKDTGFILSCGCPDEIGNSCVASFDTPKISYRFINKL